MWMFRQLMVGGGFRGGERGERGERKFVGFFSMLFKGRDWD